MSWTLRSIPITETSSLLQFSPSLCYSSPASGEIDYSFLSVRLLPNPCKAFAHIAAAVSQVPFNSLCKVLVVLMPPALQPIIRLSLQFSYRSQMPIVLTGTVLFRHVINDSLSLNSFTRTWWFTPPFLHRSLPQLLIEAAWSGLYTPPEQRVWEACSHLLNSM